MNPFLRSISDELKTVLHSRGQLRAFTENEQVFAEGDEAAFLPIVISGRIKMIQFLEPGKEVILGIFEQGEMFAVPPVFDGKVYPSAAISMVQSDLLLLKRPVFLELIRQYDEFAFAVIGWMCEMLREKTSTIQNLAIASPEHRVGHVLLKLAKRGKGDTPVKITILRRDIAEMAGLTTETTIRVIRKFADAGLIEIKNGKVFVDPAGPLRDRFTL